MNTKVLVGLGIALAVTAVAVIAVQTDPVPSRIVEPGGALPPDVATSTEVVLLDTRWEWISTEYATGEMVRPLQAGVFLLQLGSDGQFSASTDCNSLGGEYQLMGQQEIAFGSIAATRMWCEDSQEADFAEVFHGATRWQVSNNQLELYSSDTTSTSTFQMNEGEVR